MVEREISLKKEIWEWTKAILIAVVLAFFLRSYVFATSIVEGTSMDPTLHNGERVIFNKAVYLLDEPERGDIVIIQHPNKNYVKRIIGLPNETVEFKDHQLYIDGQPVNEPYISPEQRQETEDFGPKKVPADQYFVVGDNRDISKDSRNGLGDINEDDIIGRSEFIIFPFDQISFTR
ncbi:signal peptidase I [Aquisalibacillus elongatus]|uniref:Signal peptidase I n=1 Tax=Aquisalibacillus elongatus TaxID=485577 RepID=A0A3N5BYP5_9BACI|nr:signal peptidase I [Aquisalibacillus elongatus]RPF52282.1 signal peptidase I [Aquisalibacillus elongatus]